MRILGIDYGDRRIGLAMSDITETIASPLRTYTVTSQDDAIAHIIKTVTDNKVSVAVLGLPKNMDGTEGDRATITRQFGDKLKQEGLEIIYKDERLSSVTANKVLDEGGVSWKKRKQVVDTMAAQIVLQTYLDTKKRGL